MRFALVFVYALVLMSAGVYADSFFGTSAQGTASFITYAGQPDFQRYYSSDSRLQTYWPILSDTSQCQARQDILLQVAPFSCQPLIVRSDLLAEQNVPVFCQLDALRVNPLIDVKQIRNIRFSGDYPKEVAGVGFHPALASLRTSNNLLGSPFMNNIGYVVLVLKKNPDERSLPSIVNVTLQARFDYYADNAFGIGRNEFLLREVTDNQWATEQYSQSFMNGRFSVRLESADAQQARVAIYSGDRKVASATALVGKSSSDIYLPGFYCQAAIRVSYDALVAGEERARLQVGSDTVDVYEGSRFLDNRCTVSRIEANGTVAQNVAFNCNGKSYSLALAPAQLVKGDSVSVKGHNGTWTIQDSVSNEQGTQYVVTTPGASSITVPSIEVSSLTSERLAEARVDDATEAYFAQAQGNYTALVGDYPYERPAHSEVGSSSAYAAQGLERAIVLAKTLNKYQTAVVLMERYLELYGNTTGAARYTDELRQLRTYDTTRGSVTIDGVVEPVVVRLLDVSAPSKKPSAVFTFGSVRTDPIIQGTRTSLGSDVNLELTKVEPTRVDVTVSCPARGRESATTERKTLRLTNGQTSDNEATVCGGTLRLNAINAETYARIRLDAAARAPTIETNVTVGVGIEKRAIQLTPDKTKERIATLNATIKKWDQVSSGLGNVVKTMKAACFATAGVLTVKNFITGLSGEALARQQVMRGSGGWTEWCTQAKARGEYDSISQCYSAKASLIDSDVTRTTAIINRDNERIKAIEEDHTSESGLLSGTVNSEAARDDLIGTYDASTRAQTVRLMNGTSVTVGSLVNKTGGKSFVSYEESRSLLLYSQVLQDPQTSEVARASARAQMERIAKDVQERRSLTVARGTWAQSAGTPVEFFTDQNAVQAKYYGATLATNNYGLTGTGYPPATPVQVISVTENGVGTPYLAILREGSGNSYVAREFYKLQESTSGSLGSVIPGSNTTSLSRSIGTFTRVSRSSCINKFVGTPEIQYYETDPYKGKPAIVPLDTEQGWYAGIRQSIPALGTQKAFQASGLPVSFWICNVGPDGQPDFFASGFDDDICQQFNYETGQALDQFSCLTESETRQLVTQAKSALEEATSKYSSAKAGGTVTIRGKTLKVGTPGVNLPGTQCQDFMSPEDCRILFNVCDPVICPTSRCDLGGAYPVNDVVQSGVIGSTLLCLPNAGEVFVPVCLTGIKAGLDGYLSILKSHQQCLQENLATGKYVGICDELTSVYMCEFFWRQAAPLANLIVPKSVEFLYGQGQARGGGEYRTVQGAWDNAQSSVNFFTQDYGANAFEAFKLRSVSEAGSAFCRAFVSTKAPTSFESLVEPESPPQFHAWFSTIPYSDATVPATAQYKVFYHIFAGNERGVYYSVYLKDPPQSSHYQSTPTIAVDTGFVAQGQYQTQTEDFTAPTGYQQLCVRIDDKEECGFKEVSTSFALNYVRDKFVSDEINREDIKTENECISGSVNPSALLNPNLGEAAQEALDPAIYQRGVSRICATNNPGASTDPTRFSRVGSCGDERIGCWLDRQSIDNAITANNKGLRNSTLQEFDADIRQALLESGDFDSQASGDAKLNALQETLTAVRTDPKAQVSDTRLKEVKTSLDETSERLLFNYQKAHALFLYGQLYDIWTLISYSPPQVETGSNQNTAPAANTQSSIGTISTLSADSLTLSTVGNERRILYNGDDTYLYIDNAGLIKWRANVLGFDGLRPDVLLGNVQPDRVNGSIVQRISLTKDVFLNTYNRRSVGEFSSDTQEVSSSVMFDLLQGRIIDGTTLKVS